MEVWQIARSHGPELKFEGTHVTTVGRPAAVDAAHPRWHEISVYQRSDQAWVVSIRYCTRGAEVEENTEAEVLDDVSEIETFLLCYRPLEHVNRRAHARLTETERKRASNEVWNSYLRVVDQVMADIAPYLPAETVADDLTENEDTPRTSSFFRKLISFVGG
jgi:hypothetical protein